MSDVRPASVQSCPRCGGDPAQPSSDPNSLCHAPFDYLDKDGKPTPFKPKGEHHDKAPTPEV